ncbi:MAG TPA: 30S ribosomal protein S8e [Candidatus Nanoarchaeia archaeon]|nr:30S ribosomal protein S8e [Candidatus Nanoarchaeia archaeon]
MVIVQWRSKRKPSGSRYKIPYRSKRKFEMGRAPALPTLGERKRKTQRQRSGSTKFFLLSGDKVNVYNPKTKKCAVSKITGVIENQANPNYVRPNIMTKGTVITTELGKAKITNRPGQEAGINAVLL